LGSAFSFLAWFFGTFASLVRVVQAERQQPVSSFVGDFSFVVCQFSFLSTNLWESRFEQMWRCRISNASARNCENEMTRPLANNEWQIERRNSQPSVQPFAEQSETARQGKSCLAFLNA
jgi:hypothetical protein